jgi:hypothetical protein
MPGQAMSGGLGGGVEFKPFHNLVLEGAWRSTPHSGHFTPKKDLVPIVPVAEWAVGLVWIEGKTLPPPEFNTQTFQPVVSHYTDYTIPTTTEMSTNLKFAWRDWEKNKKSQSGYLMTSLWFEQASPGCKSWAMPLHQPTQILRFYCSKD